MSSCGPWHPFKLANQAYSCREWVAAVSGTLLSLLIKTNIGSAGCKLLLPPASFQACWQTPPLALQRVSYCCLWHPFEPTYRAYPWLCRMWAAAASSNLSSLLTKPTLDSAESELLLSLVLFQSCWQGPPLALQDVSCCCSWDPFKPADQAHLLLCSMWVAATPSTIFSLLTEPTLGSAESELLLPLAIKPVDKAHFYLCREWVVTVPVTLSMLTRCTLGPVGCELLLPLATFQACWPSPPFALQDVSCHCIWQPFKPADQTHPMLCSMWVAAAPGTLSSLLIKLTLGFAVCELLFPRHIFKPG